MNPITPSTRKAAASNHSEKATTFFTDNSITANAFEELALGVYSALETYSNVHRGSGYKSIVTTHLFEQAREIVLEYLALNKRKYTVLFCTARRASSLATQLKPGDYQCLSSGDIGLSLGVTALAVRRKALPKGAPSQSGGGTARLVSREWVLWARLPDKFEAGTPAIVNVIAFARALRMIQRSGKEIFLNRDIQKITAAEILNHDGLDALSGKQLLDELRRTLTGNALRVPTIQGLKPFINLDNSASTPAFMPTWNAFRHALSLSPEVKQEMISLVKSICASMMDAPPGSCDLIFTTNTTEAINLAAESLGLEPDGDTEPVVLNSLLEHSSNDLPWRLIPGHSLIRFPVDLNGFIDLKELELLLSAYNSKAEHGKKRIRLLAVSGASNVLGVCNNLMEISRIAHRYNARLLVDAAQLAAHCKISMEESGIDYLAFSAHKMYAPFGCGLLICKKGLLRFNPEEMAEIRSSGEENTAGIAALGKAVALLERVGMDVVQKEERALLSKALAGMALSPGLKVYGVNNPDSPGFESKIGVIVFSMKGLMPNRIAGELSLNYGIGVRYGCHCAHLIIKHLLHVTPAVERFQRIMVSLFPKMNLPGLTRVSFGIGNRAEDIDNLIRALGDVVISRKSARNPGPGVSTATAGLSRAEVKKQIKELTRVASRKVYSVA